MQRRFLQVLTVLTAVWLSAAFSESPCTGRLVLSFPLTVANAPEPVQLGTHLVLRVEPSDSGWEPQVVDSSNPDARGNLLCAIRNWHGAQPFLITAYMANIYPNERVIPIRGTSQTVCIRILGARVEQNGSTPRYLEGTVEVRWSGARG